MLLPIDPIFIRIGCLVCGLASGSGDAGLRNRRHEYVADRETYSCDVMGESRPSNGGE